MIGVATNRSFVFFGAAASVCRTFCFALKEEKTAKKRKKMIIISLHSQNDLNKMSFMQSAFDCLKNRAVPKQSPLVRSYYIVIKVKMASEVFLALSELQLQTETALT